MDPQHLGACPDREHGGGQAALQALLGREPERLPDKGFARGADHQRALQVAKAIQRPQQGQIALARLAEAQTRIDGHAVYALGHGRLHARGQKAIYLAK